jgi:Peptidase family M23/Repeat of unknown function (DUF346)
VINIAVRRRTAAATTVSGILLSLALLPASPAHAQTGAMIQPVGGIVTGVLSNRCSAGFDADHLGVDVAGNNGAPIGAAYPGTVASAGWTAGGGNTVTVNHASGYSTRYLHMAQPAVVAVGQQVAQGQLLGHVGTTGNSSGPHLHLEIRRNGAIYNLTAAYACGGTVTKGAPINLPFADLPPVNGRVPLSGVDFSATSAVDFRSQLTVFARGADGSLLHWWLVNGQPNRFDIWAGAGSVAGRPVTLVYQNMLNVFYRGTDGRLHHWWFDSSAHHDIWGGGSLAGDPTAAVFGNILTVFGRGTDNRLHNWWLVNGQPHQHSVWGGGSLAGNPTAVVFGSILTVFGRGTDNRLHNWWLVNGQPNQHSLWAGGSLAGDPTAAVYGNILTVFGRGTDNRLHNWWLVNGQPNQHSLWGGGSLTDDPQATLFLNGVILSVFGRGTDGRLHNWWLVNGQPNQHSLWAGGSLAP